MSKARPLETYRLDRSGPEFYFCNRLSAAICHEVSGEMSEFTCMESNRDIRTVIYDPTGEALTHGEVVDLLNDRERLRLFERAMESMAAQFIHPKVSAEQLARNVLGEPE